MSKKFTKIVVIVTATVAGILAGGTQQIAAAAVREPPTAHLVQKMILSFDEEEHR
ncbi:MAG: hypothetical protein LBV19_04905 [Streptococcaceae bacterium]|jgi:archaellum component FlaG (FlaF/FlaG flagellin family)|nr:hypothetical protein [Streptococcaceae bacterium]